MGGVLLRLELVVGEVLVPPGVVLAGLLVVPEVVGLLVLVLEVLLVLVLPAVEELRARLPGLELVGLLDLLVKRRTVRLGMVWSLVRLAQEAPQLVVVPVWSLERRVVPAMVKLPLVAKAKLQLVEAVVWSNLLVRFHILALGPELELELLQEELAKLLHLVLEWLAKWKFRVEPGSVDLHI